MTYAQQLAAAAPLSTAVSVSCLKINSLSLSRTTFGLRNILTFFGVSFCLESSAHRSACSASRAFSTSWVLASLMVARVRAVVCIRVLSLLVKKAKKQQRRSARKKKGAHTKKPNTRSRGMSSSFIGAPRVHLVLGVGWEAVFVESSCGGRGQSSVQVVKEKICWLAGASESWRKL